MSLNHVRTVVSGGKARFIDSASAVNLDLVYVTDRIIIMGYPATGFASLYRNKRRDVLKFLTTRHGDKWWVWNLCPLYENAYSPESMHGRVSRYPFPDHNPPPLPLLPLAVKEMTAWLEGDEDRIAIIHCKAGKGRSGTLLCSYLLSLSELPPPPQLDRSHSHTDMDRRARARDDAGPPSNGWVGIGHGRDVTDVQVSDGSEEETLSERRNTHPPVSSRSTSSSITTVSQPSAPASVDIRVDTTSYDPIAVGDEAQPSEEGQHDRKDGNIDDVFKLHSSRRMKPTSNGRGVSIPSQRRWCRYINLLFNGRAPPTYLASNTARVRLASVTMIVKPPSTWQKPLASLVVGGSGGTGHGKAWASVARYDDDYVAELDRLGGDDAKRALTWGGVGGDGSFDTEKMFRRCGKLVTTRISEELRGKLPPDHKDYVLHHLEADSPNSTIILERGRELRLKLHLGSLPMGWLWIIPAFHLPEPLPSSSTPSAQRTHTLHFPRSQLDFPLGPGSAVHEVLVRLEEVPEGEAEPTAKLMTKEEEEQAGVEEGGENVPEK